MTFTYVREVKFKTVQFNTIALVQSIVTKNERLYKGDHMFGHEIHFYLRLCVFET